MLAAQSNAKSALALRNCRRTEGDDEYAFFSEFVRFLKGCCFITEYHRDYRRISGGDGDAKFIQSGSDVMRQLSHAGLSGCVGAENIDGAFDGGGDHRGQVRGINPGATKVGYGIDKSIGGADCSAGTSQ